MMLGPSYPNNDVALLAAAAGACHHSGEGGENIHCDRALEKNAYGNGIKSNKKFHKCKFSNNAERVRYIEFLI